MTQYFKGQVPYSGKLALSCDGQRPGPREKTSLFSSTLEIGDHGPKRATPVLVRQVPLFGSGELFGGEWMSNLPTCLREDSRSGSQIQKGVGIWQGGKREKLNSIQKTVCFALFLRQDLRLPRPIEPRV